MHDKKEVFCFAFLFYSQLHLAFKTLLIQPIKKIINLFWNNIQFKKKKVWSFYEKIIQLSIIAK